MKKLISIFGSTGSIGLSTLKIIDKKETILSHMYFQQIKIINLFLNKSKNINLIFLLIIAKFTQRLKIDLKK